MAGYFSIATMLVITTFTVGRVTTFELGDFLSDSMMSERRDANRFCDNTICDNEKLSLKGRNARCDKKCQQPNEINGGYARQTGQCVGEKCCCANKIQKKTDVNLGNIKGAGSKRRENKDKGNSNNSNNQGRQQNGGRNNDRGENGRRNDNRGRNGDRNNDGGNGRRNNDRGGNGRRNRAGQQQSTSEFGGQYPMTGNGKGFSGHDFEGEDYGQVHSTDMNMGGHHGHFGHTDTDMGGHHGHFGQDPDDFDYDLEGEGDNFYEGPGGGGPGPVGGLDNYLHLHLPPQTGKYNVMG